MKIRNLPIVYSSVSNYIRTQVKEQYVFEQNGICNVCKCSLYDRPDVSITKKNINWKLFPKTFLKTPIHLQRNHTTDMTIGAVHAYCNAVMWQYHCK